MVLSLAQSKLRALVPERIVAGKHCHLTEVDIHGLCRDGVEEVTVVAHHEHGLFHVAEIFLQPHHGVEVEVVGRLVEEQVVGMSEESFCQHYAHLFVVRQFAHHLVVHVVLDAEVGQHLVGVAFGVPSVHLSKLVFEFCHFDAVFLVEVGFHIESLALFHVLPKGLVSHEHGVSHAVLVIFEVVLFEHREAFAGSELHCTLVGFQFAADGSEQR